MKNKIIAFTIADENNLKYYHGLKNSWDKFHKDIPLRLYGSDYLKDVKDPAFFYKATPLIGSELLKEYDTVIKLDSDQIITGDLSHVFEEDFDIGVVNNSNPKEMKSYMVSVWDIHPMAYVNCGFVVMKNKKLVDHWLKLCNSEHFNGYRMREQDLLNILVFYGDYKVNFLDSSDKWHGLISKGYWNKISLVGDGLVLKSDGEWPKDEDKKIVCIHWAGGNIQKMNYNLYFQPEVIERLKWLTK